MGGLNVILDNDGEIRTDVQGAHIVTPRNPLFGVTLSPIQYDL